MLNFCTNFIYMHYLFYTFFDGRNCTQTEDVPKTEDPNIIFTTDRIVTGIEYLGSGYDIVKANTLGDSNQGEDLGYRAPVVEFLWAQTDVGITNSLDWLQPIGGWVRPKFACGESENVSEVHSSNDLKNIVEADVRVKVKVPNLGSAVVSTKYNDIIMEGQNVKNKVYSSTYYCFTYAAGMPPSLDWTPTDEFKMAVKDLPSELTGFENCTSKMYENKAKICENHAKWLDLFNEFGTHIVTEVHLGGKLTRFVSVPSSSVELLKEKGYNVNVAIGAALSGIDGTVSAGVANDYKREIENFSKSCKINFSVLGGIHPSKNISKDSIIKWKASIPKSPMPIKIVLTSLERFLAKKQRIAYREALNFYITLGKVLPWEIELKNGNVLTAKSLIAGAAQESGSSADGKITVAKCPDGKRILFGFIIKATSDLISINPCLQNSKSCSCENGSVWILCGNSLGLEFKSHSSTNKVTCEEGSKILTGFTVSKEISKVKITACETGQSICSKNSSFIWAVCVDERLPGLNDLMTLANSGNDSINSDLYSIAGIYACYGDKISTLSPCDRFIKGCHPKINECIYSLIWGIFSA